MQVIISHLFSLLPTSFFTLRVSSLLSPLNDAPVDTTDDEAFQFSPEAEFTSASYVHISLTTEAEAGSPYFAQLFQC